MSEEPKGFTVNDRRHFAPDGSLRDEVSTEKDPTSTEEAPDRAEPSALPPEGPVDFSGFLVSLAAQASLMLGLAPGEGGGRRIDLSGARQIIGVLEMLEDKTQGRRTPDEDRLLASVLYELRMAWVERSRDGVA